MVIALIVTIMAILPGAITCLRLTPASMFPRRAHWTGSPWFVTEQDNYRRAGPWCFRYVRSWSRLPVWLWPSSIRRP